MRPRSVLLPSLHWGELRSRLLPDSQSGITSRKCGLRGRPTAGIGRSRRAGVLQSLAPIRSVARHEAPPLLFLSLFFLKACCVQLYTLLLLKPLFLQCNNNEEGKHVCLKKKSIFNKLNMNIYIVYGLNGIYCMEIIKAEIIFSLAHLHSSTSHNDNNE